MSYVLENKENLTALANTIREKTGTTSSFTINQLTELISDVCSIDTFTHLIKGDIETLTIPNPTTIIGDYAFYNKKALKTVIIPGSVESISASAFEGCDALTNIICGFSYGSSAATGAPWGAENADITFGVAPYNYVASYRSEVQGNYYNRPFGSISVNYLNNTYNEMQVEHYINTYNIEVKDTIGITRVVPYTIFVDVFQSAGLGILHQIYNISESISSNYLLDLSSLPAVANGTIYHNDPDSESLCFEREFICSDWVLATQ